MIADVFAIWVCNDTLFIFSAVNRHVGFSVYMCNESNFVPPSTGSGYTVFSHNTTTCPHRVMNITVNRLTKGIALYNAKDSPVNASCPGYATFATIEVCEVQVLGMLSYVLEGRYWVHPCLKTVKSYSLI